MSKSLIRVINEFINKLTEKRCSLTLGGVTMLCMNNKYIDKLLISDLFQKFF